MDSSKLNPLLESEGAQEIIRSYYFSELKKLEEISRGLEKSYDTQLSFMKKVDPLNVLEEEKKDLFSFLELRKDFIYKIRSEGDFSFSKLKGLWDNHAVAQLNNYVVCKLVQESFFCLFHEYINTRKNLQGKDFSEENNHLIFKKNVVPIMSLNKKISPASVLASPFLFFDSVPYLTGRANKALSDFVSDWVFASEAPFWDEPRLRELYSFNIGIFKLAEAYSNNEVQALGLNRQF